MFDRSACAKVRLAVEPHTDLSALVMVGALLRDVRNKRSTASDAADSGQSPLSGDQNQGETHATPEQTEVGTPPRAAANRPVRSERADHRRHAGLVRTTHGDAGGATGASFAALVAQCRSRHLKQRAGPPHRETTLPAIRNLPPTGRHAHQFFAATSFMTSISRSRSATSFFSRAFSASSCFRRLTSFA
jgi:hypothetical protein